MPAPPSDSQKEHFIASLLIGPDAHHPERRSTRHVLHQCVRRLLQLASMARGAQDDDISISAWGTGSQWSTFAARLSPAANGEAGELLRLLHVAADHQGMLTAPLNVARAVAAATAIGRVPEGQLAAEAADDRPAAAGAAGGLVDTLDPALYPARPAADASAAQVATAAGKATALAALRREVTARSAAATGTADG
jgi:hypothetical protein